MYTGKGDTMSKGTRGWYGLEMMVMVVVDSKRRADAHVRHIGRRGDSLFRRSKDHTRYDEQFNYLHSSVQNKIKTKNRTRIKE